MDVPDALQIRTRGGDADGRARAAAAALLVGYAATIILTASALDRVREV